jgi:hypothetical protein
MLLLTGHQSLHTSTCTLFAACLPHVCCLIPACLLLVCSLFVGVLDLCLLGACCLSAACLLLGCSPSLFFAYSRTYEICTDW